MGNFKLVLGGLFVLLTVSICVLGVLAYKSNQVANKASLWVEHSLQVLEETEQIGSAFKAIQLESNAMIIKGDTSRYRSYNNAKTVLTAASRNLHALILDDPAQSSRTETLESQLRTLTLYTDSTLRRSDSGFSVEALTKRIDRNVRMRTGIEQTLDMIKRDEKALLELRRAANEQSLITFNTLFLSLLFGIFVLVGSTFISTRYHFNRLVRAEQKLQKANELFFKLFYESPVAFAISRPEDGSIVDCNDVYARLLNCTRDEVLNRTPRELGIPGEAFGNGIMDRVKRKGTLKNVEIEIHPQGRAVITAAVSMQWIHLKDRDYILSALIDISSHKKAESDIRAALDKEIELNRMKSNFVSLASHEFRTPLTTIISSASLLENYTDGEKKAKAMAHVNRIKSAVMTLTAILEEFLSLTKIEEGKTKPRLEEINIKEFMAGMVSSLRTATKPGQIITSIHSGPELVKTDPSLLTNIVTNLLSNSIKYSPESSPITLRSGIDKVFTIQVEDRGIGIPDVDRRQLFERFYRASNAGNVQGTGLGLHITKHLVELLDGSIDLTSKPGAGTTFTASFPIK